MFLFALTLAFIGVIALMIAGLVISIVNYEKLDYIPPIMEEVTIELKSDL